MLNASGDPAAASSAATAFQIPEVNPYYNSNIKEMIKERMQQIFGDSRNAETPLALRDVKQPLSSCLNNTSVLQNDEFTPRTISLTKNLKKQTKDSKNAIQKNQEDRDDKGKEKDDNKNLSDQTPVSQSRTQIRAEGAKPKPLSSCLNKQSVLEKSNSHDKKSTTNPKQKTFFTINKKMGLVGIVFVAGVILWLWQHDYFKHLGTPSFAFH